MAGDSKWIYDIPDIGRGRYEEVLTQLVRDYSKLEGIHAIYSYGSIGNPGVSDLDILVIADSVLPSQTHAGLEAWRKYPDVCTHGSHLVKRETASDIRLIRSTDNLQHEWGEPVLSETHVPDEATLLADYVDFSWYLSHYHGYQLARSKNGIRGRLILWKSLQRSLSTHKQLFGDFTFPREDDINELRTRITHPKTRKTGIELLDSLESEIPRLFCSMIRRADERAETMGIITTGKDDWAGPAFPSLYISTGTAERYFENAFRVKSCRWLPKKVSRVVTIPAGRLYLAVFQAYGKSSSEYGTIHAELYNSGNVAHITNGKIAGMLQRRVTLASRSVVEHQEAIAAPLGVGYRRAKGWRRRWYAGRLLHAITG